MKESTGWSLTFAAIITACALTWLAIVWASYAARS